MLAMKTKTTSLTRHTTTLISSLMIVAVFLTAAHAKDVAALQPRPDATSVDAPTIRTHADITAKSLGELHSHVDKTIVKDPGMSKSLSDASSLAARREREEIEEDQPLSVKMIEMMLLVKLAYAYATS